MVAKSTASANDLLQRVFGGDPDGKVRYQTTITSALALCTAARGDTIYVAPDHTETISAAAGIALNVAGVNVIGIGSGSDRPTLTWATSTAATITITANNVVFKNFVCIGNINNLTTAFAVTGDDCFLDIEWRDTSATVEALRAVTATTVKRFKCNIRYLGFTNGTAVVNAVRLNAVTGADIFVDAYGVCSTSWVEFVTTLSTNVKVGGIMYTQAITNSTRLVVDTITGSIWTATINDSSRGAVVQGSAAAAFAVDDVSAIAANLNVPTADSTANAVMRDVVGNKTDAGVTAVGTTKSIEAYAKGLVTMNTVQTADSTNNAFAGDVIGNKTDAAVTVVGTTKSVEAYVKGHTSVMEQATQGAIKALPASTTQTIFTIAGGPVEILDIFGEVTTIVQAQACNFKYSCIDTATTTTTDIAANLDINAAAAGAFLTLNTTLAGAVIKNLGGTGIRNNNAVRAPVGTVIVTTSATNTGNVRYQMRWRPLAPNATVTAN